MFVLVVGEQMELLIRHLQHRMLLVVTMAEEKVRQMDVITKLVVAVVAHPM